MVSLSCLQARPGLRLLLLFLVEDDADDVSFVLLHVLHEPLFAGGLEATDAAAEQQHAVLHAGAWVWLAEGLGRELCVVLLLWVWGVTGPLRRVRRGCGEAC